MRKTDEERFERRSKVWALSHEGTEGVLAHRLAYD